MSGPLLRTAIDCAIACGALTVGPVIVGSPVAKADLLCVGGGGGGLDVVGIKVLSSGASEKIGIRWPHHRRGFEVHRRLNGAGAYAGYRQARAVPAALLAPVPTRIVL